MKEEYDFIIIGAGVVGSSIALGLSKQKDLSVAMVDAYDTTYRASIGNYGLAWFQSKGYNKPDYARMTERSILDWVDFKNKMEHDSKIDLEFIRRGGLSFCFNEKELNTKSKRVNTINSYYKNESSKTKILDRTETLKLFPHAGSEVYGSSYNEYDSYLSPAKLLLAQIKIAKKQGCDYFINHKVVKVQKTSKMYHLTFENGRKMMCKQLVLTAGLSNKALANDLDIHVPIKPEQGHILVTQKVKELNLIPSLNIRQSNSGTLLLGYSNDEVGFDDSVNVPTVQEIINKAIRIMPKIKDVKLLRAWASLRIIPEDGKSIYDSIDKSLHIISTHSGITFAPIHVNELSQSIINGSMPEHLETFSLKRFNKDNNAKK